MKKIKKILIISSIILFLILLIIYFTAPKTQKSDTTALITPTTTPFQYNPSNSFPTTTPTPIITQKTKEFVLNVNYDKAIFINPLKEYSIYTTKKLLSYDLAVKIASKINLSDSDKKELSNNNVIWKSQDNNNILLYTPKEQTLSYQNLVVPSNNSLLNDKNVKQKTIEYIRLLLPDLTFRIASIEYYKDNYYSDKVSNLIAEIAQVNIDQTQADFSIIPSNLTNSHTITIFFYKDLSVKTFTINNGFSETKDTNLKQTFDEIKLKTISPKSFISLTPLKLDRQAKLDQASTATIYVSTIEPSFVNVNDTLSPVYLISGKIKVDNLNEFPETVQYIAPMN